PPVLQGEIGYVLDEREHVDDPLVIARQGKQGERAIADQRGGDPVLGLRVAGRVPEDLRVEVGVDVDEPRGDQRATGVDALLTGRLEITTHLDDAPGADTDVQPLPGDPGAVDDGAAGDDQILFRVGRCCHRVLHSWSSSRGAILRRRTSRLHFDGEFFYNVQNGNLSDKPLAS